MKAFLCMSAHPVVHGTTPLNLIIGVEVAIDKEDAQEQHLVRQRVNNWPEHMGGVTIWEFPKDQLLKIHKFVEDNDI